MTTPAWVANVAALGSGGQRAGGPGDRGAAEPAAKRSRGGSEPGAEATGGAAAAPRTAGQTAARTAPAPAVAADARATRVVLLTNMVGPGDVDDELQGETEAECGKYGRVKQCLVFEVKAGAVPPEHAVRILVAFEEVAAAKRAVADLNGRFFARRRVRATYFSEERFGRFDLAPSAEEMSRWSTE